MKLSMVPNRGRRLASVLAVAFAVGLLVGAGGPALAQE